jgi:hypothetical protein
MFKLGLLVVLLIVGGCKDSDDAGEVKVPHEIIECDAYPDTIVTEASLQGSPQSATPGYRHRWEIRKLGNEVGNGGSAVVCRDSANAITSIESLDQYEARELFELDIALGDSSLGYIEKTHLAFERIKDFDHVAYERYKKLADTFEENAFFKSGVDLATIPDTEHLYIPAGCHVEQVIISNPPESIIGKRFLVNQDLWDALDSDGKATLLIHEIIYDEALTQDHVNSVRTRKFTGLLISSEFEKYKLGEYVKLTDELRLPLRSFEGLIPVDQNLHAKTYNYFDNGMPMQMSLYTDRIIYGQLDIDNSDFPYIVHNSLTAHFNDEGMLTRLEDGRSHPVNIELPLRAFPLTEQKLCLVEDLTFHQSKAIESGYYWGADRTIKTADGEEVELKRMQKVTLGEDGLIQKVETDSLTDVYNEANPPETIVGSAHVPKE